MAELIVKSLLRAFLIFIPLALFTIGDISTIVILLIVLFIAVLLSAHVRKVSKKEKPMNDLHLIVKDNR